MMFPGTMSSPLLWLPLIISSLMVHYTISDPSSDSDWTKQCNICSCIWVGGRRTANCSNKGFSEIPKDLSTSMRDIDFSNNPLYSLSDGEFISANLVDIHKLKFQNCSIEVLNEGAFKRLALLIELDLSRNSIVELKKDTFRDTIKLRTVILSYNKIKLLEDGLFGNLTSIQRIHVDHNEIESITENTFYDLPSLNDLNLGYNKLKTIEFDLKLKLPKLNSLSVEENQWVCDCRLEVFHQSIIRNNLITQQTKCEEPQKLRGMLWNNVATFPCAPVIIDPLPFTQISATNNNITLVCKVLGFPQPDVDWINNGYVLGKQLKQNKQKYFSLKSQMGDFTWNNLTIINLNYKDRGDYKCVAKNPGGVDEKNITLFIDTDTLGGISMSGLGGVSFLIIGLSVGVTILLILILILVCLYCKKSNNKMLNSKRRELGSSSEECINMSGHIEIKKGLLTEINPICKPPRTTMPTSVGREGTEVSDVKRTLLGNESVFDSEDELRWLDYDQALRKSQNALLDADSQHNPQDPPDLLSFPPKRQLSPAGSNASTIVIDPGFRYPQQPTIQSPLQSPIYDQFNIYKTLPYSRSHSPFAQGVGVPRVPRQGAGYVTIPRRPRQSWSSEPPLTNEAVGEPLYDNLGVRSTVGGSAKSLNKIKDLASTPRSNRILNPVSIVPIVESHESPGSSVVPGEASVAIPNSSSSQIVDKRDSPQATVAIEPNLAIYQSKPLKSPKPQVPARPSYSQTLPRSLNVGKLTPSKTSWTMDNAEQLQNATEKRNSLASDTPSNEGKVKKIPPRPPPKPKKRISSGPLFEDEGEDGTEV